MERTVHRLTFPKRERMVSQRQIDELFGGGHSSSLAAYPLRAVFLKKERQQGDSPVQLLISVPKKRFHHAVDRNRIKRLVREAYRTHKYILWTALTDKDYSLAVAFICITDSLPEYKKVEKAVIKSLNKIAADM